MHMNSTIAFRRSSTPSDPDAEQDGREAERRAEQSGASDPPLGEHDRADHRGEEQDRGDLERHEVGLEQRRRDGAHARRCADIACGGGSPPGEHRRGSARRGR